MRGSRSRPDDRLRELVTIQAPGTPTDDGLGGGTVPWADIASVPTVPANVKPLSGAERMVAGGMVSELSHEVTIRFRSDLTTKMRLLRSSEILEIRAIRQDGLRQWTVLDCAQQVTT